MTLRRTPLDRSRRRGDDFSRGGEHKLPGAENLFRTQGMDLTISHVATGLQIAFPAFLDMINDAYNCNWDEQGVFGRMDAIPTFRSTKRTVSVAWRVPAESYENAVENVAKVNKLISFLYPLYDTGKHTGATGINQSPLVRVSFGNLIQDAVTGRGLLGHIQGVTFDPALEFGMFNRRLAVPAADGASVEYFPKTFRLNFELTVLHGHELGFQVVKDSLGQYKHLDRDVSFQNFPYNTPQALPGVTGREKQTLFKITPGKVPAETTPANVLAIDLTERTREEVEATQESARLEEAKKLYEEYGGRAVIPIGPGKM